MPGHGQAAQLRRISPSAGPGMGDRARPTPERLGLPFRVGLREARFVQVHSNPYQAQVASCCCCREMGAGVREQGAGRDRGVVKPCAELAKHAHAACSVNGNDMML